MWQPESWSPIEMGVPGVNPPGCLQVAEKQKESLQGQGWSQQQGSFQMRAPLLCILWTLPPPETVSEGVTTCSFTMKDTDLSTYQKNVGLGVSLLQVHCPVFSRSSPPQLGGGAYLTNGCDSDNLLKMLMSTRRAPGSIKVLTWPGMCLNQSRAACGIFIRQFSKHAASPWRCNKHLGSWISWILLLNGRIILSVFAPPSCYKFSKSTSFFFFFLEVISIGRNGQWDKKVNN